MARVTVDNSRQIFGDKVTIADLAANTEILSRSSDDLDIYTVQRAMAREWKFEIADWEYEYLTGYSATFKDGSIIHVGAWAEGEELPSPNRTLS
jgi:hypothetical protein